MENPLLSSQKSSESGLQAVLHPLVLLTISDYITRHTLRELKGPIVGALLGQQNGREITIEHAFEVATEQPEDGDVNLDFEWFSLRLEQMRIMYKDPQLDLVGWYTALPKSGPTPFVLPIHTKLLSTYNESSLLLAFHPEEAVAHSVGSKLPLTIYESCYEVDEPKPDQSGDKEMRDGDAPLKLKFRELLYSVETGDAEMISMDYVARGPGNAAVLDQNAQSSQSAQHNSKPTMVAVNTDLKSKRRIVSPDNFTEQEIQTPADRTVLSPEDEELVASLTGKANAVRMLQSRIKLLISYLERLPPSCIAADGTLPPLETQLMDTGTDAHTTPSHTILRSIQALVNRLALVVPSMKEAFHQELLSEANDVHLMTMLSNVLQSTAQAQEIGRRNATVQGAKVSQYQSMGRRTDGPLQFLDSPKLNRFGDSSRLDGMLRSYRS